ncbi:hypothetical protein GGX14DRAFT_450689 [Mycena pura]|uniref:ZZ-type domain-containing protein n=1 Tax=Mycena pura TaxID=153505 RepID=A0AAD6VLL8_9AGAR|nr:hypothetical protein GGX14DRAFT_450689 [Mycena pura]
MRRLFHWHPRSKSQSTSDLKSDPQHADPAPLPELDGAAGSAIRTSQGETMGTVSASASDGPEQPGSRANTSATEDLRNPDSETQFVDQNSKVHGVLGDPVQVPSRTQFQRDQQVEDGVTRSRRAGSTLRAIAENEGVQEIGKAIFKGVPALMTILEIMSKAHPFAQLAFEPFKWAYNQELRRRDNETTSRLALFESIKNVMLISVEMKDLMASDDQEQNPSPASNPVASQLVAVGLRMKEDIYGCYAALDAMQKQSLFVRFCNSVEWGKQLQLYKDNFKTRQTELMVALTLYTARNIHNVPVHMIQEEFFKGPIVVKTLHDREIEAFYRARGGADEVFKDELKCKELLKLQNELTGTHNIHILATGANKQKGVGATDSEKTGQSKGLKENPDDREAIIKLRKEKQNDVPTVIQENMQSFRKYWDLTLNRLSDDINQNTHREANRIIGSMIGRWHLRIEDKIMRHVWRDQGWRGNAKTRNLILALRDYLVERAKGTALVSVDPDDSAHAPSPTPSLRGDDPNLPDSDIENWMVVNYLGARQLRYLQQALDPDTSGFSTINEVNSFTQSCPPGWSTSRWISYWAVGWQIFATRYCSEIDRIFTQMVLIRAKVGIAMPGNKIYVNDYIQRTWPLVTTLTSGLERFDGSDWLAEQFQNYIDAEETKLQSGLKAIHYRIDSMDIVNELLAGSLIERSIFMLLATVMRHHLKKMHACLKKELNKAELAEDTETVMYVVDVAWSRYCGLAETYRHQQVVDMDRNFEWFSCGLVEYHEWKAWSNDAYYKSNEVFVHSGGSNITQVDETELEKILRYPAVLSTPQAVPSPVDTNPSESYTGLQVVISGIWFGFHYWMKPEIPYSAMVRMTLKVSPTIDDKTTFTFSGEINENGVENNLARVEGRLVTAAAPGSQDLETIQVDFMAMCSYGTYNYSGALNVEHEVLSGTLRDANADSGTLQDANAETPSFFFKKTPRVEIMCYRPLHTRLTPPELWSFARNAVIGTLRRQKPSRKYLVARFKTIRRIMEILASTGRPNPQQEEGEFNRLIKGFTVDEWREIIWLLNWYDRVGDLNPGAWCSSCHAYLKRSRIVCLDCKPKNNTVDFDNKEECITTSTVVDTDNLLVPNHPTHLLLKTREYVLPNDFPAFQRRARQCAIIAAEEFRTVPSKAGPAQEGMVSAPSGRTYAQVPAPGTLASKNGVKLSVVNTVETSLAPPERTDAQVPAPDTFSSENDGKPSVVNTGSAQETSLVPPERTDAQVPVPDTLESSAGGDSSENDDGKPSVMNTVSDLEASLVPPGRTDAQLSAPDTLSSENDGKPSVVNTVSAPETSLAPPERTDTQVPAPDTLESSAGEDSGENDDSKPSVMNTVSDPEASLVPPERTNAQLSAPDTFSSENNGKPSVMECLICNEPLSTPCWYCMNCPEDAAFICLSCETKIDDLLPWEFHKRYREEGKQTGKHNVFHLLLRFNNSTPPVLGENNAVPHVSTQEEEMDRRLHALEQRLLGRLDDDKVQLEARLAKIEAHLQALVAAL